MTGAALYSPRMNLHRLAEERSLAYHRAVAERLRREPGLLGVARARVAAWLAEGRSPYYARRWSEALAGPLEAVIALMVDEGEAARAMRQATPFAGMLDPRERWRIWRDVRARLEAGTAAGGSTERR
jgi:hypothetical protein